MDIHGSAIAHMPLSTHLSTEGGVTYGVFHLSGWMLGVITVVMFTFIVLAALVPIKYTFSAPYGGPTALAFGTVSVSAVAVIACLGTLLVTWWTTNPWGVNDDNDGGVVIGSIAALVIYVIGVVCAYVSLYEN